MKTSIVCVLDRSGSMNRIMKEAIGSMNSFFEEQRKMEGDAEVTVYAFDDKVENPRKSVNLRDCADLTLDEVVPRGMTALYDAIGEAITRETNPNTIVLIQTDGDENCSRNFDNESIKEMIRIKEDMGWEFHFVGAGIDAFKAGAQFGMNKARCVTMSADAVGMNNMANYFSGSTTLYRSSVAPQAADISATLNTKA